MYNLSENTCRDIIPYQDPWSVIMKDNKTYKEQLLRSAIIYLYCFSEIHLDIKPDNIMLEPKIYDFNTVRSIWPMHTAYKQQLVYSSSRAKQINPEWILEDELTDEGFSFKSTRNDSKFQRAVVVRCNRNITIKLIGEERTPGYHIGCGLMHPTNVGLEFMKEAIRKEAELVEPAFIARLEQLIKMIEPTLPKAHEKTHTNTTHTHQYRQEPISEKIKREFGMAAFRGFYNVHSTINLGQYYRYLKEAETLKREISSYLENLPNSDRLTTDLQKIQAVEKLVNLNNNPAVWQYEQFTKITNTLVRNLLKFVTDECLQNNNNNGRGRYLK
jgi:hypothetical protein